MANGTVVPVLHAAMIYGVLAVYCAYQPPRGTSVHPLLMNSGLPSRSAKKHLDNLDSMEASIDCPSAGVGGACRPLSSCCPSGPARLAKPKEPDVSLFQKGVALCDGTTLQDHDDPAPFSKWEHLRVRGNCDASVKTK
ncbi:hypothetical protein QBC44DRAFT_311936 [Cladorrhinum sp. PSN332]|nr:hypothetical protein QBC44DRAFT_311936 [Cladorrhinum sp. PSN332]